MSILEISRERILLTPTKQTADFQAMLDIELLRFFRRKISAGKALGLRDNCLQMNTRLSSSMNDPLTRINREWSKDIISPGSDLGQAREHTRFNENILYLDRNIKHPRGDGSLIKYFSLSK
jgi:hypothetical protein